MGVFDTIKLPNGDEAQVKLWGRCAHTYHLGDIVPALHTSNATMTYLIALREGGFVNIVNDVLVSFITELPPIFDKWGSGDWQDEDYLFNGKAVEG